MPVKTELLEQRYEGMKTGQLTGVARDLRELRQLVELKMDEAMVELLNNNPELTKHLLGWAFAGLYDSVDKELQRLGIDIAQYPGKITRIPRLGSNDWGRSVESLRLEGALAEDMKDVLADHRQFQQLMRVFVGTDERAIELLEIVDNELRFDIEDV